MKAFPKIVKAFCRQQDTLRARPKDIFDVITVADSEVEYQGEKMEAGFTASITYGDPRRFWPVMVGARSRSRYEALFNLLASTEVLNADKPKDGRDFMEDPDLVEGTGAVVDKAMLAADEKEGRSTPKAGGSPG